MRHRARTKKTIFNIAANGKFPKEAVEEFLRVAHENSNEQLKAVIAKYGNDIVNVTDLDGRGAVAFAVRAGHMTAIDILLAAGAPIDKPDNDGNTPLMEASERGYAKMVEYLLDRKANMELFDRDGKTALMHAAYHAPSGMSNTVPLMSKRKLETISLLLSRGADIDAVDNRLMTTEQQAKAGQNFDALKILKEERQRRNDVTLAFKREMVKTLSKIQDGIDAPLDAPQAATFKKRA